MAKKILIIDDDSRNIFALTAVLKAKGFVTVSATSMKDGLEKLENEAGIGIVLMDMMMPDMDGYEAIPHLKNHPDYRHLPIVSVTAQAMKGDREKCLAAGADDYLAKPVDIDKLVELLNQHVA